MTYLDFSDRVVIVTGAGRGLGRAYAELLAARGAAVVVADTGGAADGAPSGEDPATEAVAGIEAAGGKAVATTASVATEDGARTIVETAVETFGRLDAVVNNAGIYYPRPWLEVSPEEFQAFLDVHFLGTVHVSRAAWPHLVAAEQGRIVNTVSNGMLGVPDMTHYGSAKGAVYGLTRNLAVAGAADGIRVNAISPGAGTRMLDQAGDALSPDIIAYMKESMPPRLAAPVAAYLAHETCSITGEVLTAAGGMVNRLVIGNTAGIADPDLTPETVADRLEEILAVGSLEPAPLMMPEPAVGS